MKNGNGTLKVLARRMDRRFEKMERDMKKDVRALRKDTKSLFEYVIFLDDEFQQHKTDKRIHATR